MKLAHLDPTPDRTPDGLPGSRVYAVQLLAGGGREPGRVAGTLEHVLSGRRHDFDDGPALLACLALEQALQAHAAAEADNAGRR